MMACCRKGKPAPTTNKVQRPQRKEVKAVVVPKPVKTDHVDPNVDIAIETDRPLSQRSHDTQWSTFSSSIPLPAPRNHVDSEPDPPSSYVLSPPPVQPAPPQPQPIPAPNPTPHPPAPQPPSISPPPEKQSLEEGIRRLATSQQNNVLLQRQIVAFSQEQERGEQKSPEADASFEEEGEEDDEEESYPLPPLTIDYRSTLHVLPKGNGDPSLAQPTARANRLFTLALTGQGLGDGVGSVSADSLLHALENDPELMKSTGWQASPEELVDLLVKASGPSATRSIRQSAIVQYCTSKWLFDMIDQSKNGVITSWDLATALRENPDVNRELTTSPRLAKPLLRQICAGKRFATLADFYSYYAHVEFGQPRPVRGREDAIQRALGPAVETIAVAQLEKALDSDHELRLELGWDNSESALCVLDADDDCVPYSTARSLITLRWAWTRIDVAYDGFIGACELGDATSDPEVVDCLGLEPGESQGLWRQLDPENTGTVQWHTFYAYFSQRRTLRPHKKPRSLACAAATATALCLTAVNAVYLRFLSRRPSPSPSPTTKYEVPAPPQFPQQPSHRYRRIRRLGEGNFGVVHLVERISDGLLLVAKEPKRAGSGGKEAIRKAMARRMRKVQKEAAHLMRLKHPYILRFVEAYWEGEVLVIITEYCDGGDLSSWLTRNRTTASHATKWKIFGQTCEALRHMHERNIMHRDLKPANILLTSTGNVKLADFGLARGLSPGKDMAHTVCGTEVYMAPEVHARQPYGFAADIFSLGCILYQLARGRGAFCNVPDLMQNRRPTDTPPYCKRLVDDMLQGDPSLRPTINTVITRLPFYKMRRIQAQSFLLVWMRRSRGVVIKGGRHFTGDPKSRWPVSSLLVNKVLMFLMIVPELGDL